MNQKLKCLNRSNKALNELSKWKSTQIYKNHPVKRLTNSPTHQVITQLVIARAILQMTSASAVGPLPRSSNREGTKILGGIEFINIMSDHQVKPQKIVGNRGGRGNMPSSPQEMLKLTEWWQLSIGLPLIRRRQRMRNLKKLRHRTDSWIFVKYSRRIKIRRMMLRNKKTTKSSQSGWTSKRGGSTLSKLESRKLYSKKWRTRLHL